ncbi:MAG TPA: glycosyltransferase family 39 protein [Fimbriiglobus sp.]
MGVAHLIPFTRLTKVVARPTVAIRVGALVGLFLFFAGLAAILPPVDDELYYWCWSRNLQLSYYDHPPMVAYLIRMTTAIFGDTVFALRLPAVLASVVAFGIVAYLTRWRRFLITVLLTPLFTFGAILVTPDTPLLLFWSLYLLWLTKLHDRLALSTGIEPPRVSWGYWTLGGVLLGCGVLGKYTMALAVPAGAVSLLFVRPWSRWIPGFVWHGVVSFVVASPILIFNIQQDFVPLRYQWEHATATGNSGLKSFGEFVGVQILGFGLLPFVLLPWAIRHYRQLAANSTLRVCLFLYVVPFVIFVYKSIRGPLEGNWAIVAYIGFWPVAAVWFDSIRGWKWGQRLAIAASAPPALCVFFLAVHLIYPWPFVPPRPDRVTRQFDRIAAFRKAADAIHARDESIPVYASVYQDVAVLRFFGVDARQIDGISRPSHFTRPSERTQDHDHVFVFSEGPLPAAITYGFALPELIFQTPLIVRGEWLSNYYVWELRKLPSP